jgi:hypothetical protein
MVDCYYGRLRGDLGRNRRRDTRFRPRQLDGPYFERTNGAGPLEPEVLNRLAEPSTAKLSNVEVASTVLDPDSKDLFSLLDDPLKGVDHSRITVWNVSGVVDAPNALGATMHDPFSCRAYFIDGNLAHTLVLFDHDH